MYRKALEMERVAKKKSVGQHKRFIKRGFAFSMRIFREIYEFRIKPAIKTYTNELEERKKNNRIEGWW